MVDLVDVATPLTRGLMLVALLMLTGTVVVSFLMDRASIDGRTTAAAVIDGWLGRLPGLLAWFPLTSTSNTPVRASRLKSFSSIVIDRY